jgi:MinD superfamily P-loop ATPase
MTEAIESYTLDKNLPVMGRISFDPLFTKAMVEKQTIIEYDGSSGAAQVVEEIWKWLESGL